MARPRNRGHRDHRTAPGLAGMGAQSRRLSDCIFIFLARRASCRAAGQIRAPIVLQNFCDVVRERSGFIRICNRMPQLNDGRRRPEAGTICTSIGGRELGISASKFDHGQPIAFRKSSFPAVLAGWIPSTTI
jgi:hypothetical protein